jgi:hypothetical protein
LRLRRAGFDDGLGAELALQTFGSLRCLRCYAEGPSSFVLPPRMFHLKHIGMTSAAVFGNTRPIDARNAMDQ